MGGGVAVGNGKRERCDRKTLVGGAVGDITVGVGKAQNESTYAATSTNEGQGGDGLEGNQRMLPPILMRWGVGTR